MKDLRPVTSDIAVTIESLFPVQDEDNVSSFVPII